ncbi:hypothetical protein DNH61_20740 [Paenibacillus sambharensis]|uniref:DUF2157 domain-containing protein n=1 Tax=Paenibacillus sambharensis TaxID=1803190 RepID=A0A2W1LHG4_9BACL|nr:hypothetical protein [Paenibacillus sambharensis]PZD93924.1 hypothetical protein DNH61_20740 [Paenibacillus sambharensis]
MDQERRTVIIREIDYWRRNKLLPDQYCDFLLNLYAVQDQERTPSGWTGKAATAVQKSSGKHWLLAFGAFSLICLVALYFNAFHPLLQTALSLTVVTFLLSYGQRKRAVNESAGLSIIGIGILYKLGIGLYMLHLHDIQAWGWTAAFLAGCSVFWIIFGMGAGIPLLHLGGWVAAILVYALLLAKNTADPAWYEVQLYWVPVAFVFGWFSWFVHRWSKPASAVLLLTGVLLWFMPEVHAAIILAEQDWIQVQLIVKIGLGGTMLFFLRKHWIAWVA